MKKAKTFELLSHSYPTMRCPMCGDGFMKSVIDHELSIVTYSGKDRLLKVHAIICEECDYTAFTKETMIAVLEEGFGKAAKVIERNGEVFTKILH